MADILTPGQAFPAISVPKLGGGKLDLAKPADGYDWKMIVVYRGKHCPICTRYLGELNDALNEINALGVDVVAVSADSEERATAQISAVNPSYDVGYDLTIDQMKQLGLYISSPANGIDVENPFAEPGFFVVNEKGELVIIDISNVPFARPSFQSMLMGLRYIRNREGQFPVNGTYAA